MGPPRSGSRKAPRCCIQTGARDENGRCCYSNGCGSTICVNSLFVQPASTKNRPGRPRRGAPGTPTCSWEWRGEAAVPGHGQLNLSAFVAATWTRRPEAGASRAALGELREDHLGHRHRRGGPFRPPIVGDDSDDDDDDDDENWGWFETDEPELAEAFQPPIVPPLPSSRSWDDAMKDERASSELLLE